MLETATLTGARPEAAPLFDRLHEWVVTVDHKRLGLMYVIYALVFLVIGGLEADDHADPARVSEPHRRVAAGVQSSLHDARDDDGLLRRHPDGVRVCELSRAVDDRRPRHGVSATQRLQLLDQRVRRAAALFQLSGRRRAGGSGQRAGCGLVRVRAAHGQSVFEGPQHRLLDHRAPRRRIRQHRRGRQHRHDHTVHALSRHDARSHAAGRLAQLRLGRAWCSSSSRRSRPRRSC